MSYEIAQYTPYVIMALCFFGMLGLSLPTVQKPDTWHPTLFIIGAVCALNLLLAFVFEYAAAHGTLLTNVAMYGIAGALDLATLSLIVRYSRKGRDEMGIILGLSAIISALLIIKILLYSGGHSQQTPFKQLLAGINIIYYNYAWCILALNAAQIAVIISGGKRDGWNISRLMGRISGLASVVASPNYTTRGRNSLIMSVFRPPIEKAPK
ncbi:MAG: hypothetical protein COB09_16900 [Thalassobium sp.]|nr:MAG: hypothetical protein COB09_16900 [Thalassobium sp.]